MYYSMYTKHNMVYFYFSKTAHATLAQLFQAAETETQHLPSQLQLNPASATASEDHEPKTKKHI